MEQTKPELPLWFSMCCSWDAERHYHVVHCHSADATQHLTDLNYVGIGGELEWAWRLTPEAQANYDASDSDSRKGFDLIRDWLRERMNESIEDAKKVTPRLNPFIQPLFEVYRKGAALIGLEFELFKQKPPLEGIDYAGHPFIARRTEYLYKFHY